MNKDLRDALIIAGSAALLGWLMSKDKYACPRCNNPVSKDQQQCPNCGQPLSWVGK